MKFFIRLKQQLMDQIAPLIDRMVVNTWDPIPTQVVEECASDVKTDFIKSLNKMVGYSTAI